MIQRLMKDHYEKEEGFTLVELLVVIVILGILAAIVVFAVGGITNKGDSAANSTDTSVLQAAEEAYFAQVSAYAEPSLLRSGKYLRTASTKNHICLQTSSLAGSSPSRTAADYEVVSGTGTNCSSGFTNVGS